MLHSLDAEVGSPASTVRSGFKWADVVHGDALELCVCTRDPETHEVQGAGKVLGTWFGRFFDIPARYLRFEHEAQSREYGGLLDSMRRAYGEELSESRPVTIIIYRRES
jgi:hypothetical protein